MKAAAYIRVSTEKEEQAASLDHQRQQFLQFIKDKGFDFYDTYVDVESGTTDKREGLKRLIEDAEKGNFDIIISKELSRLARHSELAYRIRRIAENRGIHIITMDGAVDTTDPSKQAMFGFYSWMYEQESQRMSDRIKAVYKTKAKNGKFMGSNAPYGYEVKDGKLYPRNDYTVNVVKEIYQKYLDGWGFDKIARSLSKAGHPTPAKVIMKANAGVFWQGSSIREILQNSAYCGDLVQHKETSTSVTNKKRKKVLEDEQIAIVNAHEPIISRKNWEKVQELIKSKKGTKSKTKDKKHLFTGVLFCADCGTGLWFRSNRQGYICGKYAKHGNIACSKHLIIEDSLKNIILDDIRSMKKSLEQRDVLSRLEARAKKVEHEINIKLSTIENKISKLNSRRGIYIDMLADGTITKVDYVHKITDNQNELQALQSEKLSLMSNIEKLHNTNKLHAIKEDLNSFLQLNRLTKEVLHRLIDKIEVAAVGSVKIYYRFAPPQGF